MNLALSLSLRSSTSLLSSLLRRSSGGSGLPLDGRRSRSGSVVFVLVGGSVVVFVVGDCSGRGGRWRSLQMEKMTVRSVRR